MITPLPSTIDLSDADASGVFTASPAVAESLAETAELTGFCVRLIDLRSSTDKPGLLTRLACALEFPDWFGHNWDALSDSLTDLAWLPAGSGYVFVLNGLDLESEASATLLDILEESAAFWQSQDTPFWALVTTGDAAP